MKVLYLTDNPNLFFTTRILQCWLKLAPTQGLTGFVAAKTEGTFTRWLAQSDIDFQVNPMPWPNRRWPLPSLWHAWRLARWARRNKVEVIHCNEHNVYPFASLVRRFLRRPIVCHVRFMVGGEFCRWAFGKAGRQPDALLWTSMQQQKDCGAAVEGIIPLDRQHLVAVFGSGPDHLWID